jgi:hypothetical protein
MRNGRGIIDVRVLYLGALAVLAVVLTGWACTPTEPGDINIYNNNQATNNAGGHSASPSPGSGSDKLPEGSTIRVGIFGQDCPSGVTPPPNSSAEVKIACRGAGITATPKSAAGTDLDASVHGTQIEWSVTGGAVSCTGSYLGNVFNQLCVCPAGSAGATFSLTAKVKDKTGVLNGKCVA